MAIILPDRESVELLHDAVLSYSTGRPGILNDKIIHGAIERPVTYTEYIESYNIDTVCALLIDSIARNHGYNDGNKRTALLTAIFTYRINGVHFVASEQMNYDFDELVMWVVNEKPSIDKLTVRLQELKSLHAGKQESWGSIFHAFSSAMSKKKH